MSTFDAFEKTVVKPVQPQQTGDEGVAMNRLSAKEGSDNVGREVKMFGSEGGNDTAREAYGGQSKKWQDFISGFTEQPQQVTSYLHESVCT